MKVPQVVIVGRPNVGKSSVFNWLAGRRLAVVDDMAGVTRDRITYLMQSGERYFEIVDTGGMGSQDSDNLTQQIEDQINTAMESADLILFVVDTQAGQVTHDEEISRKLRYVNKPILCVANKTDGPSWDAEAEGFHRLGRGRVIRCSAKNNRFRDELLEEITQRLPLPDHQQVVEEPTMKLAIVGRRNVGKSTFVNTIAKAERMIVSEIPGTTRDSVDVRFELDGKVFTAIDTPGLRRSVSIRTDIDFYGTHRAKRSIRRADVVLLFFDATEKISRVDKQLASYIADNYKPCVFVVNKWDLVHQGVPTEKWVAHLRETFQSMWHVPIAFVTGMTGKNVKALLNHAQMLFKQSQDRVSTAQLNQLVRLAVERHGPPLHKNRRPKIYYATQVGSQPPTIVLMCNHPESFSEQYRRYLLGVFRDQLRFGEVPIKLYLNRRSSRDERDDVEPSVKQQQDV
ncbi:MAG: ribosome biogenesis GTPase Der [Planctomycetota bacterium]|nr:ribosome biogenesis GTPase Der [Planctomycetota bacterium]MDA1177866.1 ribosome biogenesis GTPase Der [Planctomycetota bacterium]